MIRAVDKWFPGYVAATLRRPRRSDCLHHLMLCVADHFEPFRDGASRDRAEGIVKRWVDQYPGLTDGIVDADGRCPQHTFFYPQ